MSDDDLYTREEIYDLIWSKPISTVAPKIGVSDSALIKVCKKLDIPRPHRGYWAKLRSGKSVHRPRLPPIKKGEDASYVFDEYRRRSSNMSRRTPPALNIAFDRNPKRLTAPINSLQSKLRNAKLDKFGRVTGFGGVVVFPALVERSCTILHNLAKVLRESKWTVRAGETGLEFRRKGIAARVTIFERGSRTESIEHTVYGRRVIWDYHSTGKLTVEVHAEHFGGLRHSWTDTAKRSIEEEFGKLLGLFQELPSVIKRGREAEKLQQLANRKSKLRESRILSAFRHCKHRAKLVNQLIASYEQAERVRQFASQVRKCKASSPHLERMGRWADKYADHLDPFTEVEIRELGPAPLPRSGFDEIWSRRNRSS